MGHLTSPPALCESYLPFQKHKGEGFHQNLPYMDSVTLYRGHRA